MIGTVTGGLVHTAAERNYSGFVLYSMELQLVGAYTHKNNNKENRQSNVKLIDYEQRPLNWRFTSLGNKCIISQCKPGLLTRTH